MKSLAMASLNNKVSEKIIKNNVEKKSVYGLTKFLTLTFILTFSLMLLFELTKSKVFPNMSLWESHSLTIAFTLFIVLISAYFIWRKQESLYRILSSEYDNIKKSEQSLKDSEKRLQELNAEKDKFFSIIAHDLRSPFNSFLGFTKMLAEDLPAMTQEQIQKIVVSMRKSETNLYNLLENLLDWSLLKRGVTTLSPMPFQLMQKISESLSSISELAAKKEIEIRYNVPENLIVFADENMLGSIIRNLVSNAVKFTPKERKIAITAKSLDNDWIEISVKDSGIGMNQEMVKNLFKLDVDTSRKGTNNEPSTGLGLIICKEFVEKHGGKLWVESEEGKGTTFYFTLPSKVGV